MRILTRLTLLALAALILIGNGRLRRALELENRRLRYALELANEDAARYLERAKAAEARQAAIVTMRPLSPVARLAVARLSDHPTDAGKKVEE